MNEAEKDRKIEELQRRLEEAERGLAAEGVQSPASGDGEVKRLTGWLDALEVSASALLESRRWKLGSFLGDLSQRASRKPRAPMAEDAVRRTLEEYRTWKGPSPRTVPAEEPVVPIRANTKRDVKEINRVQVGCGPHNLLEDWWNVDIRGFPGIDAVMDATAPWPYLGLDYVFGEHFLEHLPLAGGLKFLEHAGNSLKPDGILRLSTPNLKYVLYNHALLGEQPPEEVVDNTLLINRGFHGWGHRFLYTREVLEHMLAGMGFRQVSFFSYGESETPALRNLERHGKYRVRGGYPSVIVAEATRGEAQIRPSEEVLGLVKRESRYVNPEAH